MMLVLIGLFKSPVHALIGIIGSAVAITAIANLIS